MNTPRIVISGINGFVGHHLARELHGAGVLVVGIGHDATVADEIKDIVEAYHQADLITTWPETADVTAVIHLAGLAAVGPSFDDPQKYINANSAMVTNLCEYYQKQDKKPRVIVVSSGAIYDSNQTMPITESGKIGFSSPYAVSKILTENQCAYYHNRGLDCIVARPFNHIGPGQALGFIVPDFYKRLSELADGETTIEVGNIDTRRDYTDVRDIVRAYAKLALAPSLQNNLYNVCSGQSLSGSEILDKLKNAMDKPDVTFQINPALVRPTDIPEIFGDSSRLQQELDWKPEITINQTIKDFVESAN